MSLKAENPIGIFDSGVGGLTVAHAVKQILPNESIIYFGDTAHLPYGDKSKELITFYSRKITEFFIESSCKSVVIACNTASSYSYEALVDEFSDRVLIIDMVHPVVEYLVEKYDGGEIGIIGTKGTISSRSYVKKISSYLPRNRVKTLATPLLVPMIEEGFVYDDISNAIIRAYLGRKEIQNIKHLILGCTHYPIIKNQIRKFYDFEIEIFDSTIAVNYLKEKLKEKDLLNTTKNIEDVFYFSDYTEYFEKIAKVFFEKEIKPVKMDIWQ
ncbi:glutamate racemase [Bacteroidota bacterium]